MGQNKHLSHGGPSSTPNLLQAPCPPPQGEAPALCQPWSHLSWVPQSAHLRTAHFPLQFPPKEDPSMGRHWL